MQGVSSQKRLKAEGLSKAFGPNLVLSAVDLEVEAGEVMALLGMNGAGKSTFVKILCGIHSPTEGRMFIDGQETRFADPRAAIDKGVRLVPQEVSVITDFSVGENIFLDQLPGRHLMGLPVVDLSTIWEKSRALLERAGLDVDPRTPMHALSMQQKRLVEIARALAGEARLLILDEPTASMSETETEALFRAINGLKAEGTSIIYISHYLEEVFEISDKIAVLKDGEKSGEFVTSESSQDDVLLAMLGRSVDRLFPVADAPATSGTPALEIRNVSLDGMESSITLEVWPGEIVGVFGLLGSGADVIGMQLFGSDIRRWNGTVTLPSGALAERVQNRIAQGVGYLPAERKADGIVPNASISDNVIYPFLGRFMRGGWLNQAAIQRDVTRKTDAFAIRANSIDQIVSELSGGNQQKVVLARWLDKDIRLLILEEPTRGVDLGARADIYQSILKLAREGLAVLVLSSDVEEIAGLSDRAIILRDGKTVQTFPRGSTPHDLMTAASRSRQADEPVNASVSMETS